MRVKTLEQTIKDGGIAVMASDTLYGVMGSARIPETVEKIYKIRGRDRARPFIVLLADPSGLAEFGVQPSEMERKIMERYWPGKLSIVLPCMNGKYMYLHRGGGTIAFRIPEDAKLRQLLRETGPLVAPSANTEGNPPAETIEEARAYFGDTVDVYEDVGRLAGLPSTLVTVEKGTIKVLREGTVKIDAENF